LSNRKATRDKYQPVFIALAFVFIFLTVTVRSFEKSNKHLLPVDDEVAFLDIARDYSDRGGILNTIGEST